MSAISSPKNPRPSTLTIFRNRYSSPPSSPTSISNGSPSAADWKQKYYEVSDLLAETRAELDDFTRTSKELEEELERDLERTEKAQEELRLRVSRVEVERDEWKNKFLSLQHSYNTTSSSLQRELDAMRQSVQLYKAQIRELELGNDDLERNERQATSSLADVEQRYAKALEDKILLEHELQDKAVLEETCQRLRDELRDSNLEITVLKDQIDQLKRLPLRPSIIGHDTSSTASLPLVSPTGSDQDSLLPTQAPDLSLTDLLPTTPVESSSSASIRLSLHSRLSQEILEDDSLSQSSPTSFASAKSLRALTARSTSNSTPTQATFFQRALSPTFSGNSTASTRLPTPRRRVVAPSPSPQPQQSPRIPLPRAGTSRSKGVQMVSEMRARVRTLEQKIHSNMPRLRGTHATTGSALGGTRIRPPSRTGASASGNTRTPRKVTQSQDPNSPWVMIADDGEANTTIRQSPDRASQTVSVANGASSIELNSPESVVPPSRPGGVNRSASALGRRAFTQGDNYGRPTQPPPTTFPSTTQPEPQPPRAASAGAAAAGKPRVLGFTSMNATTSVVPPISPASEGRPTTPTHIPQPHVHRGGRRVFTQSSPSKPPVSGLIGRQRLEAAHHTKIAVPNTLNAGTTPGRAKSRVVTSPETPPPPVPSLPLLTARSRIPPPGAALGKSKIGRPLVARVSLEPDVTENGVEDGTLKAMYVGRGRSGTTG
ncbi:NADH:ubiquinone oxidoreductase [Tulasnella sp. 403]|nr:NADH:ubiquinone oxidoreductase [Tulasnella sp. 403]